MNGKHVAALSVFMVAGIFGFVAGFAWGQSTRAAVPGATNASFSGGKLTVTVDTYQALGQGLSSLLGG